MNVYLVKKELLDADSETRCVEGIYATSALALIASDDLRKESPDDWERLSPGSPDEISCWRRFDDDSGTATTVTIVRYPVIETTEEYTAEMMARRHELDARLAAI